MGFFETLRGETSVIKSAPWSFILFLVVGASTGYGASSWYYSKQITERDGQIGRYRVALGLDKTGDNALVELTNTELQSKATTIAGKLDNMCSLYQKREQEIQQSLNVGEIDQAGAMDRRKTVDTEMSYDFIQNLRADTFNVDNELRRRLGPTSVAAIVGISPSIASDDGTRVDIRTLMLSSGGMPGFNMDFTCPLANSIEQMVKLLPPDAVKP
jgi:hypothetical protein